MDEPSPIIANFGGNVRFQPKHFYAPKAESEVLDILNRHALGKIRVVGAGHSWSDAIVSDDVLIDLSQLNSVHVERDAEGNAWATVGSGCTIQHALDELARQANVTLPALGLITEQTIAGAISTGTHGSGRHSLSHYMAGIRVAAYDVRTGQAAIFAWSAGPQLRAARCALGCMGVVLSVKFRCASQYTIDETIGQYATLDEILSVEGEHPLQQFFLIPHAWTLYAQHRKPLPPEQTSRSWHAGLYRLYWLLFIDVGLHLTIKLLAAWVASPSLVRFFYRWVLPWMVWKPSGVVDRSDRILVMEHELFRHLEIEIFVPASRVREAAHFVQDVLSVFDGQETSPTLSEALKSPGMLERLQSLRGTFTHHYPITFRKVLADDTLISMTADASEPWYAISFITYVEPRDAFFELASFLAESMAALFGARPHWGKYFPLESVHVAGLYPNLAEFRELCRQVDPKGVFRSAFVNRVMGEDSV